MTLDEMKNLSPEKQKQLFTKIKNLRHTYKQGNYACQYGAQVARLALTIGCSRQVAQSVYDAYWKRNWAINKVADAQIVKVCNGSKWLYNPISRFWYSLRHEKDRFSTLVQGSGVFAFDLWLRHVRASGPPIIGQFHDEFIALIRLGRRERCTHHINEAIRKVNEELRLNRELDCDVQYGSNYAAIH